MQKISKEQENRMPNSGNQPKNKMSIFLKLCIKANIDTASSKKRPFTKGSKTNEELMGERGVKHV